jgi:hypothetical protein
MKKSTAHRKNMSGDSQVNEVRSLAFKLIANTAFLEPEDIKVLEFLSTKGSYNNKRVVLIPKI